MPKTTSGIDRWLATVPRRLGRSARMLRKAWERWPVAILIGTALLVLFAPLGADLFLAISPTIRQRSGLVVFLAVLGACAWRLWEARDGRAPRPSTVSSAGWWGCLPGLAGLSLAIFLLQAPENLGAGDWDVFLEKYEAVRRTIWLYGQFPWWDPWSRGGFPLAGNPQCGVIGVATPLVLAFGTSVGLRLAAIVCVLIATEGARRVASDWLEDPLAASLAGLIYGMNGGVLVQVTAGYHLPMSFCAFPWLLHHGARLDRRPLEGFFLGAWLAFNVLNGIIYYSVYAALIFGVAWVWGARSRSGATLRRYLVHSVLAGGTCLGLSGWRLATTGLVFQDYPRHHASMWSETPVTVLAHLIVRPTASRLVAETNIYFWDSTCYLGPVVLLLAVASLNRGWRWWHTLTLICGALAIGSVEWYHPSYWLANFPLFSTMHMVGRWRIMAMLGMGLAAADELAVWRKWESWPRRWLAVVLAGVIVADYVELGAEILPTPFRIAPEASRFPGPATGPIVQVDQGMAFPAVLRGYGMIAMPEPLLGYNQRAPSARTWRGLAGYSGEAWTADGPIEPVDWSPNRIEFRVRPGQRVTINQNPGSWWWANGRPAFPDWRCAETLRKFEVTADPGGRLVVEIRPRGLRLGLALHLVGLVMVVGTLIGLRVIRNQSASESPRGEPGALGGESNLWEAETD